MLITLVIIGVIAALTIPNLMQKYQEQVTVKKVQKFYSNLANAYNLAVKDNGLPSEWIPSYSTTNNAKIYDILFKPYFKIAKNCGNTNSGNCIGKKGHIQLHQTNADRQDIGYGSGGFYTVALDDGATLWWRGPGTDEIAIGLYAYIDYDINGAKEPNQWGIDTFEFIIYKDKLIASGIQTGKYSYRPFNSSCANRNYGLGCAAWVIYKGNMDYLHCDGLTWNSRSCKDK